MSDENALALFENFKTRSDVMDDLKIPPGNRLEPLKGSLAGSYSIRIGESPLTLFTD